MWFFKISVWFSGCVAEPKILILQPFLVGKVKRKEGLQRRDWRRRGACSAENRSLCDLGSFLPEVWLGVWSRACVAFFSWSVLRRRGGGCDQLVTTKHEMFIRHQVLF